MGDGSCRQMLLLLSSLSAPWEGRTRCPVPGQAGGALGYPGCSCPGFSMGCKHCLVLETPSLGVFPAPGSVSQGQALGKVLVITKGLKKTTLPQICFLRSSP